MPKYRFKYLIIGIVAAATTRALFFDPGLYPPEYNPYSPYNILESLLGFDEYSIEPLILYVLPILIALCGFISSSKIRLSIASISILGILAGTAYIIMAWIFIGMAS